MDVLASVGRIVSRSRSVFFHPEQIRPSISKWGQLIDSSPSWDHPCHFFDGTGETVKWIFVLDVLNHCFWPDPGQEVWTVDYGGSAWSGYWGLAACLKRAGEADFPITDPAYLCGISEEDLASIFSGEGVIPMFEERLLNLREAGSIILSDLRGDILALLHASAGSAVRLVKSVVSLFPSFCDEAAYRGERVKFWKRAQIFAFDVFNAFGGRGLGDFRDAGDLTAFADYKLPQVLRLLGIISYAPELAARIDALEYLRAGSEEEIEIRAMTIWSVEEIRKALLLDGRSVTSAQIDNWLWRLGQVDHFRKQPYHRCRTIFY